MKAELPELAEDSAVRGVLYMSSFIKQGLSRNYKWVAEPVEAYIVYQAVMRFDKLSGR